MSRHLAAFLFFVTAYYLKLNNMQFSRILSSTCFFILLTLLSSCSATHHAYLKTLKVAFAELPDITLESSDISASSVDLIYVKKGNFPTVVLALAFIEDGQYKWISSDKASLIEKNGRIIKTLSLDHNLDFVTAQAIDPLANALDINDASHWHRQIDLDSSHFSLQITSSFSVEGPTNLIIQEQNIETILINEHVKITDCNNCHFANDVWINQFWLNKASGKLIRSKQKITPDGDYFDISYVSRALRL